LSKIIVRHSAINGALKIPTSKSHTMRAIFFAMMANGRSRISDYLHSPDTDAMIRACRALGAKIEILDDVLVINGVAGKPQLSAQVINVGNSGQVLRFIGSVAALIDEGYTILTGDDSICHLRPMAPLLDGLEQLGCFAKSSKGDGHAPIIIRGPVCHHQIHINGRDSQPVSGLLMLAAFAPHAIEIHVQEPGEKPWVDLTLDWLKRFQIPVTHRDHVFYQLKGNAIISGFDYQVPGDMSSLAFPLVAATISGTALRIENVDMSDVQGDKRIIDILIDIGAPIEKLESGIQLHAQSNRSLSGFDLDINDCIDALPILAVLGCYVSTPSVIRGATIARCKESDRIAVMANQLNKMGAQIKENPDGLEIIPSILKGAHVNSHHDHRIAMALAIAGMNATGETIIHDIDCIEKSYPHFVNTFKTLGADFE
jgi:3-phosphoshikimate 1-carboxyvinyltransferase